MKKTTKNVSAKRQNLEINRSTSKASFKRALMRIIKGIKSESPIRIMIKGKQVVIPKSAKCSVEFEVDGEDCELEFQFSWKNK